MCADTNKTIQGRRVDQYEDTPGTFWKADGKWYGMTPNGHLAGLANHNVVEHEDGTITVAPSIKVSGYVGGIRVHDGERTVKLIRAAVMRRLTYADQVATRDENGHFVYGHRRPYGPQT